MARPRRIRAYNATNGKEWDSGTYLYDGVGNIKAMKTASTTAQTLIYDKVSRVKEWAEVVNDSTVESRPYGYDGFGNLTFLGDHGISVDPQTNHIAGAIYDDAGNLTEWGGVGGGGGGGDAITYTYYPTNELETMLAPSWNSVYAYSADGERVARYDFDIPETANGTTYVIRDLGGKPLREYYETGCSFAWQQDWIWRDGLALATVDGDGMRFFHLDHLGTPRLITNEDGTVVAEHNYYPFGEEIGGPPQDGEIVKFTGHERDLAEPAETTEDLDYMHARYYSPQLGRFLSVDPVGGTVGSSQSWNAYSYALNNPLRLVDEDGRTPASAIGAAIGAIAGTGVAFVQEVKRANRQPVTLLSVARNIVAGAAGGATTGAIAGACGGCNLVGAVGVGAGSAVVGGGVRRAVDDPSAGTTVLDGKAAAVDATAGALGGAGGLVVAKGANATLSGAVDTQVIRAAGARAGAEGTGITGQSLAEAPARAAIQQLDDAAIAIGAAGGEAASAGGGVAVQEKLDELSGGQ